MQDRRGREDCLLDRGRLVGGVQEPRLKKIKKSRGAGQQRWEDFPFLPTSTVAASPKTPPCSHPYGVRLGSRAHQQPPELSRWIGPLIRATSKSAPSLPSDTTTNNIPSIINTLSPLRGRWSLVRNDDLSKERRASFLENKIYY